MQGLMAQVQKMSQKKTQFFLKSPPKWTPKKWLLTPQIHCASQNPIFYFSIHRAFMGLQTNTKVVWLMHPTWPQGCFKVYYIRNGKNQKVPPAAHRVTRWTYHFGYPSSMGRWVDWHIRGFWAKYVTQEKLGQFDCLGMLRTVSKLRTTEKSFLKIKRLLI